MRLLRMLDHGAFIGSRFTGKEVRQQIAAALSASEHVVLDFGGVQSVSDSFLDEMLGMLIEQQGPSVLRRLVFSSCERPIEEAIRFSLEEALISGGDLVFR